MEELRTGVPLVINNVTLLPVERVVIYSEKNEAGQWLAGLKEPYAIVIRDDTGVRAFKADMSEVTVASLAAIIPDIDNILASAEH